MRNEPASEPNRMSHSSTSGTPGDVTGDQSYEPPSVTRLGSLTDLTLGHGNTQTDGIGVGSVFA